MHLHPKDGKLAKTRKNTNAYACLKWPALHTFIVCESHQHKHHSTNVYINQLARNKAERQPKVFCVTQSFTQHCTIAFISSFYDTSSSALLCIEHSVSQWTYICLLSWVKPTCYQCKCLAQKASRQLKGTHLLPKPLAPLAVQYRSLTHCVRRGCWEKRQDTCKQIQYTIIGNCVPIVHMLGWMCRCQLGNTSQRHTRNSARINRSTRNTRIFRQDVKCSTIPLELDQMQREKKRSRLNALSGLPEVMGTGTAEEADTGTGGQQHCRMICTRSKPRSTAIPSTLHERIAQTRWTSTAEWQAQGREMYYTAHIIIPERVLPDESQFQYTNKNLQAQIFIVGPWLVIREVIHAMWKKGEHNKQKSSWVASWQTATECTTEVGRRRAKTR